MTDFENPNRKTVEVVKEAESKFVLPVIKLGENIPQEIIEEVQRAIRITFDTLKVPLDRFKISDPALLVDVHKKNDQNLFTFERLPDSDLQVPVIVVSSIPLYDYKGRETIALYEPDNAKIFLNLRRIHEALTGSSVSDAIATAITVVEEAIHFVQDKYWNRDFTKGSVDLQSIEMAVQHDAHPIEAEAAPLKKQILNILYPELGIKVRGVDF